MSNEDNACIRYLMKEMDPSEEVLMERAMMEDEDLLIEVECMRQTLRRLDDNLPLMDPPSHITEKIVKEAARQKKSVNPAARLIDLNHYKYVAAAAMILGGLLTGALWMQNDSATAEADAAASSDNRTSAAVSSSPSYSISITPVFNNGEEVEPWIDRNDILRFQDQFGNDNQAAYDSILNSSTKKLKLINDPLERDSRSRSLQLTGSD